MDEEMVVGLSFECFGVFASRCRLKNSDPTGFDFYFWVFAGYPLRPFGHEVLLQLRLNISLPSHFRITTSFCGTWTAVIGSMGRGGGGLANEDLNPHPAGSEGASRFLSGKLPPCPLCPGGRVPTDDCP